MFSAYLRLLLALVLVTPICAQIAADTTVVSMLGLIPQCAVPCVINDLFTEGGCPMTTAGDLSACACTNVTIQSHLSACVQTSCGFVDQKTTVSFASTLCEAYPKDSRANELKATAIVTIILSVPFLLMRLYARWLKTGRLYTDDAYAITAAILLIAVSVIILRMSVMGFGLHYWNVPAENGVELLKLFYVCQMLYVLVQIFSKIAILSLFSRLLPNFIRWFKWSVRGMIAFMYIHGIAFFFLVVFQCLPINAIWDKTINGTCLPITAVIGLTGAGLSIVEDFIILLLPLREIWKLQMSTKKKIGVILLISVGSFACVTSIVRLKFVLKYANTYDSTWDNVDVIKWSLIELLSACICGNLLPLKPLVDHMMPNVRSVFSWASDWSRRSSNMGTDQSSGNRRNKSSEKPRLISTLAFTQMSLSPGWDWKRSDASDVLPPSSSAAANAEKSSAALDADMEEGYARSESQATTGKTTTRSTTATHTSGGKTMTTSDDGSERVLMPSPRNNSKRWSRARSFFGRS